MKVTQCFPNLKIWYYVNPIVLDLYGSIGAYCAHWISSKSKEMRRYIRKDGKIIARPAYYTGV